jgi:hypothetical protein
MKLVLEMQSVALHMREFAQDATLPGYAEKMIHAAEELEQQASERAQKARQRT